MKSHKEGDAVMTVGTKVHQALASLRTLEGQLESFALDTDDQQSKQMYNQMRQQISQMASQLSNRVNYMEQEEPTYKISGTTQGQSGAGGQSGMTSMTDTTGFTSPTGATSTTGWTGITSTPGSTSTSGSKRGTKKKSR